MSDADLQFVDEAVRQIGRGPQAVIPILQAIQEEYRYLPSEALERVCAITDITPARLEGVATFYSQFRRRPMGRHLVRVCIGTACHVKGAGVVHDAFYRHLGIAEGDDTDPERIFTVQKVACLGCCTLAPVVQIDETIYGHVAPEAVPKVLRDFLQQAGGAAPAEAAGGGPRDRVCGEVRVSVDSMDIARGSGKVFEAMRRAAADSGAPVRVKAVGAHGMAYLTPLVEVVVPGRRPVFYGEVRPEDAEAIMHRHFPSPRVARRVRRALSAALDVLLTDEAWEPVERRALDVRDPPVAAFLGPQQHLATEGFGRIDPLDLDEYLAAGGFRAAERCLRERTAEEVIDEIRRSGLRGRGGAGFPTGEKWRRVREAPGEPKYLVCNGDEGDPGAFMDRMLLESYPYRIIEGMIVGAHAVGAAEGIFYIRHEYPLAVRRVREALERCRERGILGERVLGTEFRLDLRIMEGAGAFVCGEETAMMASIEGRRGTPRLRPPYPSAAGLWGKPTLINNTETFALVPWIVRNGAGAFAAIGTEHSKGTKVFALAGKVVRGGLIEVPMGVTLGRIVEEIGGGIAEGKRFKAVQVGGPSGGCVPASLADTPVDYEALTGVGAMMGSGGLVVLDEADCMVDIARYFLSFTQDQSCGKCTYCRVGTRRMLDILERIVAGEGRAGDLEALEHLGRMVKQGSLCGLGKTAPNPVLSTLRYFREEYEAHLAGRCPAGVCKDLITYRITDDCIGCTRCAQHCPADAIPMKPYEKHEIDTEKCIRCGTCRSVCPSDAVRVD